MYVVCAHKNRLIEAFLVSKQYTICNIKKKLTLYYPKSAVMGIFFKGLKKEFQTAVVHKPSMFEQRKVYCMS